MQAKLKALILVSTTVNILGYSQLKQQTPGSPSACGITLKVTGGQFSPRSCVFEIITRGEACGPNAACPPDYALSMKDGEKSHIMEVILFNFRSFGKQTFRFDPAQNPKDFNGQVLDERATVRNLLKGEVSLEPMTPKDRPGDQTVKVSFDVSFSNGIHIQGSGEVPVRRVSAP